MVIKANNYLIKLIDIIRSHQNKVSMFVCACVCATEWHQLNWFFYQQYLQKDFGTALQK